MYSVAVAWPTIARLVLDTLQSMADKDADSLKQGCLWYLVLVRGSEYVTSKACGANTAWIPG